MVFSSIPFLFRFLPCFFILYFLAPGRMRNLILFFGSLVFYAWGEPVYIVLMLFSTVSDYVHGLVIAKMSDRGEHAKAKAFLVSSLMINLALLGLFKYTGALPLPVGISFYTFQTMSYTIDVYRKEVRPQKDFIAFGAYVSMFPQLIAGPIVKYRQVAAELAGRRENAGQIAYGIRRFIIGLGKKVLLANQAGLIWEQISAMAPGELSMFGAWLGMFAFAFQIYYDFSGYSDMAVGLGAVMSFHFPENFHYPYMAESITQFWRRWHMTLSGWFRDYVYIPLGGNRKGLSRQILNILIVWLLTGIWHGAGFNFLFWGLWFAFFLILEKCVREFAKHGKSVKEVGKGSFRKAFTTGLGWLYTMAVVLVGWVFFSHENLSEAIVYCKAMFCFQASNGAADTAVRFLAYNHRVLWVIFLAGMTSAPAKGARKLQELAGRHGACAVWDVLELVFLMVVFLLSTAFLVDASYNPFLYFRF